MESSITRLPRSRLGIFDEDTCRAILQELGEQIVPESTFEIGIDEVVFVLYFKYGKDHIGDALRVLYDVLSEDELHVGFDDVSDIWQSWRRSWKHRDDDLLDPWLPHFGSYVLPLPTPQRILKIKSDNYRQTQSESRILSLSTSDFDCLREARRIMRLARSQPSHHENGSIGPLLMSLAYYHKPKCSHVQWPELDINSSTDNAESPFSEGESVLVRWDVTAESTIQTETTAPSTYSTYRASPYFVKTESPSGESGSLENPLIETADAGQRSCGRISTGAET
ncbi:MAG: hypothetical protein Q9227_005852 [Pyrenula ochraceoflavens]